MRWYFVRPDFKKNDGVSLKGHIVPEVLLDEVFDDLDSRFPGVLDAIEDLTEIHMDDSSGMAMMDRHMFRYEIDGTTLVIPAASVADTLFVMNKTLARPGMRGVPYFKHHSRFHCYTFTREQHTAIREWLASMQDEADSVYSLEVAELQRRISGSKYVVSHQKPRKEILSA
jgi:hypothetical protein